MAISDTAFRDAAECKETTGRAGAVERGAGTAVHVLLVRGETGD